MAEKILWRVVSYRDWYFSEAQVQKIASFLGCKKEVLRFWRGDVLDGGGHADGLLLRVESPLASATYLKDFSGCLFARLAHGKGGWAFYAPRTPGAMGVAPTVRELCQGYAPGYEGERNTRLHWATFVFPWDVKDTDLVDQPDLFAEPHAPTLSYLLR